MSGDSSAESGKVEMALFKQFNKLIEEDETSGECLVKVISGGQWGADRAGLQAARIMSLETGGTAPPGFQTYQGPCPELGKVFGLRELDNGLRKCGIGEAYVRRSMANVDDSDATLVFRLRSSVGTDKTIAYCKTGRWGKDGPGIQADQTEYRHCLVIRDLAPSALTSNVTTILKFLEAERIYTLNVAGHRDDLTAGMYDFTGAVRQTLIRVFQHIVQGLPIPVVSQHTVQTPVRMTQHVKTKRMVKGKVSDQATKQSDTKPERILFDKPDAPYGQLSNFWKFAVPMSFEGRDYPTSEHAYQSQKFVYPDANEPTRELAKLVACQTTPCKAKLLTQENPPRRYAWQVKIADMVADSRGCGAQFHPNWDAVRSDVMLQVLRAKFQSDATCQQVLLSTGTNSLVEHSWTDSFWADGGNGSGRNELGRLLEIVRTELVKEQDRQAVPSTKKRPASDDLDSGSQRGESRRRNQ